MKCKLFAAALALLFITGCSGLNRPDMPRIEASQYYEKLIKLDKAVEIELQADSSNLEVYSWDKKEIKLEMKKRIRGRAEKVRLEEKLKDFNLDIMNSETKLTILSEYKGSIGSLGDISNDIRIHLPSRTPAIAISIKNGSIRLLDDMSAGIKITVGTADIDINRLDGKFNITGDSSNIRIGSGSIKSGVIQVKAGNICIKAAHDSRGQFSYETGAGNIDIGLPASTRLNVETSGSTDINEFAAGKFPDSIKAVSHLGKISVRKY